MTDRSTTMDDRYLKLAERIGLAGSDRIAGLFRLIADPDEADLLLNLPASAPQLGDRFGLAPDRVEEMLRTLFIKGLVFPSHRTDPPTYRMGRDLVQFHDATLLWPEAPQEYLDAWKEFMEQDWPDLAKAWSAAMPKPVTRVIPVGVSLKPRARIMDFESVEDVVAKSDRLAVTKCTCRLSMHNCDRMVEACLQVNRAADYALARGTGREVTKAEALDLLRRAEEEGLIHVTFNRHRVEHLICNCCPCCCQTMPVLIKGGTYVIDPSRFQARFDQENCTGCGLCHDRCYFSAIDFDRGGAVSLVDPEKCMGCGLCLLACPEEAIEFVEVRPKEFIPS